ncbi:MAG: pyrimidine 5'-nucleotidase [Alphaproteobacteria bacterium]|nr:pyrimidine 5'-nucleotidase [Alphaproteobacteria bacterium]
MKTLEQLRDTQTWVFDLDNTLYPASCGLMSEVSSRMTQFVAERLNLDREPALSEQKRMFREYGTTLRGLMNDHDVDPTHFMDYVHDVDYALVKPLPRLTNALRQLPGRKVIFTNASTSHAESVLRNLGIDDLFEGIFDVAAADYIPKPNPKPYEMITARHNIDPRHAVMLEDIAPNLQPAAEMGMTTVWVRYDIKADPYWAVPDGDADYIHHETEDLASWLETVLAAA